MDKKKLSAEDRLNLQVLLQYKTPINEIANKLGFHKSSIYREIEKYSIHKNVHSRNCNIKHIVCNGCHKKFNCTSFKTYYDWEIANKKSLEIRKTSREKVNINEEDLKLINDILLEGIRKNSQSLHHVYVSYEILHTICSERNLRRLIEKRLFDVKVYELKKYVRYNHKYKKSPVEINLRDIKVLLNRTYKDFLNYVDKHPDDNIVQFDSVIGKINDRQAILTITFPKYQFQFGLLIQKGSYKDVVNKIKKLFRKLGDKFVKIVFAINICDNGVEFSRFTEIEIDSKGEIICKTFYTRPYRSTDKSSCENLHRLLRYAFPKGKSLDNLTQDVLDEVFSHINSYVRKSLNDKTPYDLVKKKFGKEFLEKINIKRIPNKKVKLKPII